MTKYRLVRRAQGWVVQSRLGAPLEGTIDSALKFQNEKWVNRSTHRWHWLATLHLWFLRERARRNR